MKFAIIILVVIALLTAGVLLLGGTRSGSGNGKVGDQGGWAVSLGEWLTPPTAIDPADLKASCLSEGRFVLTPGVPCTVVVRSSDAVVRTLSLHLIQAPGPVKVVFRRTGARSPMLKADLKPGDEQNSIEIQVMREGGELTLVPLGIGTPTIVQLGDAAG